ncbi:cytochrome-c peroxidase [Dyadobacter subterraneus]|uniref:Cytochrome-c peroxidase n=1 Tax=Dyadobacter subterraneus TaxID=2773304 RepID=A0ABR9WG42_9BACT|nr:cytochrome c peroxidase [Dyadobacter subterraneus]MBE9464472.1 cytochrome-c peroxidase [Dyadobacter subterraneus]
MIRSLFNVVQKYGALFCVLIIVIQLNISCSPKSKDTPTDPDPEPTAPTALRWVKPTHFPDPVYDLSKNPLTVEGALLGKYLFYDGILSRTNVIGCGTCHQQATAFTHHGHDLSHGVDDQLGTRNAPAVQNLAWNTSFFWDGNVHVLDSVSLFPITNKVEMDETMDNILIKLRATPIATQKVQVDYPKMFKAAYGTKEITSERVRKALSQFMMTMVSANSKYDYYVLGDAAALSADEQKGLAIFKQKCSSCHSGELFTDYSYRNNGLPPIKIDDQGRYGITKVESDRYKFKVPSLRNVGLTGPYMHDGRFTTLDQVLTHYTDNMQSMATLDDTFKLPNGKVGIVLTQAEKQSIILFLNTLSDTQFTNNAQLSDPGIGNAF